MIARIWRAAAMRDKATAYQHHFATRVVPHLETIDGFCGASLLRREAEGGVRLAHPLYGEVLRSQLPVLAARRVRQALADTVTATGARRREDVLRVATWRLDAGASTGLPTSRSWTRRYGCGGTTGAGGHSCSSPKTGT